MASKNKLAGGAAHSGKGPGLHSSSATGKESVRFAVPPGATVGPSKKSTAPAKHPRGTGAKKPIAGTPRLKPRPGQSGAALIDFGDAIMTGAMDFMRSSVDEMYRLLLAQVPPPPPLVPLTKPGNRSNEQQTGGWNWADFLGSGFAQGQAQTTFNQETAVNGLTQLYSLVRENMPNAQVLGALVQLMASGNVDPSTTSQLSSAIFSNVDLAPALRTMDSKTAADAVCSALKDPCFVCPLADFFGRATNFVSTLIGDRVTMMLLLHVVTNAPQMHDMMGTLCKLASVLVKDDVGRVVLDAAVTRACPNHRIALLKAVDYSHVDEETIAPLKEVLMRGLSQAANPAERRDMIVNVFPEVFTHQTQTTGDEMKHEDQKTGKKTDKVEKKVHKAEETRKVASPKKDIEPEKLLDELLAPEGGSPALESAVDDLIEILAEETSDNLIEV